MIGAASYFAPVYFAPTYWPKVGDVLPIGGLGPSITILANKSGHATLSQAPDGSSILVADQPEEI